MYIYIYVYVYVYVYIYIHNVDPAWAFFICYETQEEQNQ
jgi:hypothetical protein